MIALTESLTIAPRQLFLLGTLSLSSWLKKLGILWCHLPELFSYLPAEIPLNSEFLQLTPASVLEQLAQVVSRLVRGLDHGNTKPALG